MQKLGSWSLRKASQCINWFTWVIYGRVSLWKPEGRWSSSSVRAKPAERRLEHPIHGSGKAERWLTPSTECTKCCRLSWFPKLPLSIDHSHTKNNRSIYFLFFFNQKKTNKHTNTPIDHKPFHLVQQFLLSPTLPKADRAEAARLKLPCEPPCCFLPESSTWSTQPPPNVARPGPRTSGIQQELTERHLSANRSVLQASKLPSGPLVTHKALQDKYDIWKLLPFEQLTNQQTPPPPSSTWASTLDRISVNLKNYYKSLMFCC